MYLKDITYRNQFGLFHTYKKTAKFYLNFERKEDVACFVNSWCCLATDG